ncbi:MAG TPA: HAD-IA family hydrolase [Candidatus Saccharimonadales bacterium]|nr:HAD-IA family hydrolase [Candidatus Saccharimonadales bacterium]
MNSFWHDLPRPFFILAPMEAVTDVVFRHVVAEAARPDIFFTEFTNASSYCSPKGEHSTHGRLAFTADEHPMVVQIWGDRPAEFAQMAKDMAAKGFKGVDINMGCPVKNAVKNGGSGLIRKPELAAELIAAAKEGGLPVSVKTRLGYSSVSEWRDWLTHILKQDVVNLTIHLRTRKEMSKVPAHFELIPEIKKLRDEIAPNTLLTINGDVRDRQHGEELVREYGVDGVMIGRGVFTNPFAFEVEPRTHSRDELLGLLNLHLDLFDKYSTELEPRRFEPLKRFFKIYVRNFAGAGELRAALMNAKDTGEARQLIAEMVTLQEENATSLSHINNEVREGKVKAIVFDSDGTLVDTRRLILHGYRTVLKRHGLTHLATDEFIQGRLGKPVPETYEQLVADQDVDVTIEQLVAEHDEVQNRSTQLIQPYPETEKLLRLWRIDGIKLCLFTSGNRMMIRRNFAAAGIENVEELFDEIITADDKLPRKPEPDAINELLHRVDVDARDAVVVGDHPYDIQSGRGAHAGFMVGILHGFGDKRELLGAGADSLSDDLIGLKSLLKTAL